MSAQTASALRSLSAACLARDHDAIRRCARAVVDTLSKDGKPDAGPWNKALREIPGKGTSGHVARAILNDTLEGNLDVGARIEQARGVWRGVAKAFDDLAETLDDQPAPALVKGAGAGQNDGPFDGKGFAWQGKACEKLTSLEYQFMLYWWNRGRPIHHATRQDLLDSVWRDRKQIEWESMKGSICRLNRKLNEDGIFLGFETDRNYNVRATEFARQKKLQRT